MPPAMLEPSEGHPHTRSYYAATAHPSPERPALKGEVACDVCVIGAGFTGLSAALHLAEKGYRVLVLEAARIGWGASGRNGGQIINGYSRDLGSMARRFGEEAAQTFGQLSIEGAAIIRKLVTSHDIACDYKPGNLFVAKTPKQLRQLKARQEAWTPYRREGLELVDRRALATHIRSDLYIGGLLDRLGGHIHPLNLALGEAAAVEQLGGTIHEASKALAIEEGPSGVIIKTGKGLVQARFLVAAGNAYLGRTLPRLATFAMPVSTQIITTAPLGEKGGHSILPSDLAVEDMDYFLDYFRLTADHRLLFGGGTLYSGTTPANIIARLHPQLLKVFPQLQEVPVDFAWSGNFALTLSRAPHLGRLGQAIYFAHGYSGHGVTTSHLAGRMIADAIDGDARQFDAFAAIPATPFPGGRLLRVPLTVLGSWWYRLRDQLGV
jgi:gamma-glutamylputrescine oxidase